jgi:UrcA family protein
MKFAKFSVLAVAACLAPLAVASAKEAPTVTVDYTKYDLNSAKDVDKLYARLRSASRRVCAPVEGNEYKRGPVWRACFNEALTRAVSQVNHEAVSALHFRTQRERPV